MPAADLAARTFRAGAAYDLVVFDRLAPEEQRLLAELRDEPGFYGVLRPREGTGRTVRAVDRDTALLWLTLQAPAPLPFFARDADDGGSRRVAELVLDGVLEVEDDAGRFVAGPAALSLAAGPAPAAGAPASRLGRLADAALRHAAALGDDDVEAITTELYSYGRLPLTARWARRLPDRAATLAHLGAAPGGALHAALADGWRQAPDTEAGGWIAWTRTRGAARSMRGAPTHKLYVSPLPAALPEAVAALVDVLGRQDRARFKVGADAAGVLRPDKLVAYFEEVEALHAAADLLAERLDGMPAHGVPFTAEIAGDGLLSWGMDPPREARVLAWQGYESWRLWLVRRLAAALAAAARDADAADPAVWARERLRWDGVDVDRWTPSAALWRAA